jgi:hypothetical protein
MLQVLLFQVFMDVHVNSECLQRRDIGIVDFEVHLLHLLVGE